MYAYHMSTCMYTHHGCTDMYMGNQSVLSNILEEWSYANNLYVQTGSIIESHNKHAFQASTVLLHPKANNITPSAILTPLSVCGSVKSRPVLRTTSIATRI